MRAIPTVSWRDIQGNKYSKSLNPAMLKQGLPITMKARVIGNRRVDSDLVTVVFDRDYVINWLIVKLIKPLSNYGIKEVINLLYLAWEQSNLSLEPLTNSYMEHTKNNEQKI